MEGVITVLSGAQCLTRAGSVLVARKGPQFLRNPNQRTLLQCLSDPICRVDGTLFCGMWSCLSAKWMVPSSVGHGPACLQSGWYPVLWDVVLSTCKMDDPVL